MNRADRQTCRVCNSGSIEGGVIRPSWRHGEGFECWGKNLEVEQVRQERVRRFSGQVLPGPAAAPR